MTWGLIKERQQKEGRLVQSEGEELEERGVYAGGATPKGSTSRSARLVGVEGKSSLRWYHGAIVLDGEGHIVDAESKGDGPDGDNTSGAEKSHPPSDSRRANRIASPGVWSV